MAKTKIKVPKVVNGMDTMVEIEIDDSQGPQWPSRDQLSVLNKPIKRIDGPEKVTGRARYTHDVRLPNMLYGRILPSPHPLADIKSVDTSAAEKIPGVIAVIRTAGDTVRYQGDPIAAVAAETPEAAEDGIRAVKVVYDVKPHVVDVHTAMSADGPKVYSGGNVRGGDSRGNADEVNQQLAGCAAVVEGEYNTPFQHHTSLETHGVVVDFRGGDSAIVYASTQGTHTIPGDAAQALGLDQSKVVGIVEYMGGGFGSKFGLDLPGSVACRLSAQTKRPVHLMLTRGDEFLMAGNRSGSVQNLKLGADKDGNLVAMTAEQHRLGGLGEGTQRGQPFVYHVPHVHRTMDSLHMNIDSSRAMRAPGCPQASFAMESIMDDLAAKLDIDPLEFRKKNLNDAVYDRQIKIGADRIGWATGRNRRPGEGQTGAKMRGMGVALTQWGGGGGPSCEVTVAIAPTGAVDVSVGTQDLGTGTRTYVAAIVAEELGLTIDQVRAHIGDSRRGAANSSGGSTTTASLAPAVKDAAFNARLAFFKRVAPALGGKPEEITAFGGRIINAAGKSLTWKQACASLGSTGISERGQWKPGLSGNGVQGAQFAEVEVDAETGKIRVLKMVGVQNCGLPLNRLSVESQINGGMIFGLGYALYEGKVTDRESGLMVNNSFEEYKVTGATEIPECIPIIDDADDRGVIGMAEPAAIPMAGAIANAIFNACGVRVRSLPITPDKILNGLAALKKGATA